jgi:type IV pilus assembly protein PilO
MAPPKAAAKAAPANALGQMNAATQVAAIVMMVAVLLVIYYLVFYSPLAEDLQRETSRRGEVAMQLSNAQRDLQRYNDDVAELERLRGHARELRGVLPDNADIPGFMRSINTLAEASGLQITLIQPEDERVEQYYVRVPVRLEVRGSYLALARFFRAVSQLPRVINMENIDLSHPEEEGGEVRLEAKVLATTFRSLSAEEAAAQQRRSTTPGQNGAARPQGGAR